MLGSAGVGPRGLRSLLARALTDHSGASGSSWPLQQELLAALQLAAQRSFLGSATSCNVLDASGAGDVAAGMQCEGVACRADRGGPGEPSTSGASTSSAGANHMMSARSRGLLHSHRPRRLEAAGAGSLVLTRSFGIETLQSLVPGANNDAVPSTSGATTKATPKAAQRQQQPRTQQQQAAKGELKKSHKHQPSPSAEKQSQDSPAPEICSVMSFTALDSKLTPTLLATCDHTLLEVAVDHVRTLGRERPDLPRSEPEAYTSVMDKLVKLYIALLAGMGSPQAAAAGRALPVDKAIDVLHTLGEMGFNVGGSMEGLKNLAEFYRTRVLPLLLGPDGRLASSASAALAIDMLWAFGRLYAIAARAELLITDADSDELSSSEAAEGGEAVPAAPAAVPMVDPTAHVGDASLFFRTAELLHEGGHVASAATRHLAKLTQALVYVNIVHYPLLQAVLDTAAPRVAGVQSSTSEHAALGNVLDAMGRLNFTAALPMAEEAAHRLAPLLPNKMVVRHVIIFTKAFARLRYENPDWMKRASFSIQLRLGQCTPTQVASVAWAYATRGTQDDKLFDALAERFVRFSDQAKRRDVACILHAFAKLGHKSPLLLDACEAALVKQLALAPQQAPPPSATTTDSATDTATTASTSTSSSSGEGGATATATATGSSSSGGRGAGGVDMMEPRHMGISLRAFVGMEAVSPQLFQAAAQRIKTLLADPAAAAVWEPQNCGDVAIAFTHAAVMAREGHGQGLPLDPELYRLLADRVMDLRGRLGKSSMVDLATAFSEAGLQQPRLMEMLQEASEPGLADMGPAYLGRLMRAFALVRNDVQIRDSYWRGCLDAVCHKWTKLQRNPDALSNIRWAVSVHPASQALAKHPAMGLLHAATSGM